MGFSTTQMDVSVALKIATGWPIVSASTAEYFTMPRRVWESWAERADYVDTGNRMFFRLNNGDFVEVEKQELA